MIRKILSFFILFILFSFNFSDLFNSKPIKYTDNVGGKKSNFEVDISIKNKNILVEKKKEDSSTLSIYNEKYLLKEYKFTSKNFIYTMKIDKNRLVCIGNQDNQKKSRRHLLKNNIWVQDFNYGFSNFLKSGKKEFKFILINPNDFTSYEMIATKENKNILKINSRDIKTQKVKVTLSGFKSMFWKAEIWYDINDQKMIKYVSNEGPGTATIITTINLK